MIAVGVAAVVFAVFFGIACMVVAMDATAIARAWRSGGRNGLISPCRGYVYRDGQWHPREVER